MLQLSALAERLSKSLVIWSAAGNHPLLTFFLEAFGVVLLFSRGFFGILLSLYPHAVAVWIERRAFPRINAHHHSVVLSERSQTSRVNS